MVTAKLISAFVFTVAVHPGLCATWSNPEDRFPQNEAHIVCQLILSSFVNSSVHSGVFVRLFNGFLNFPEIGKRGDIQDNTNIYYEVILLDLLAGQMYVI